MTNREAYLDDLDELLKEIDALGFQDGRRFDPASRLSDGVPGQLMIGG